MKDQFSSISLKYINENKHLIRSIKLIVTLVCLLFVFFEIKSRHFDPATLPKISVYSSSIFFLVLVLVPVNWMLEVFKWKIIRSSWGQSYDVDISAQEVLKSLMLGWILPFTIGDVVGRYDKNQTIRANANQILLNRASAFSITILFGLLAIHSRWSDLKDVSLFLIIILTVATGVFLILKSKFIVIWVFSVVRYWVFTLQFFLLFSMFLPELSRFEILMGVFWIFLVRSVLPGFLGAIGIREASAIVFFTPFVLNPVNIVIPGFLIWFINLVLPSVFAAFYLNSKSTNQVVC